MTSPGLGMGLGMGMGTGINMNGPGSSGGVFSSPGRGFDFADLPTFMTPGKDYGLNFDFAALDGVSFGGEGGEGGEKSGSGHGSVAESGSGGDGVREDGSSGVCEDVAVE